MKSAAVPSILVVVVLLAVAVIAEAQEPKKVPRIAYLSNSDSATESTRSEAFRRGLRDLGYIEGKNILVEYRDAEGNNERMPSLVAELVQLKVDVLVVGSLPSMRAAKQATKRIPIVMVTTQDPVATGFIESLARPGGNITGVTSLQRELSGKRLELLKELNPGISRVGAFVSSAQVAIGDFKPYEAPARALKLQLQLIEVRGLNPDIDAAFQAAAKGRANALITVSGNVLSRYTKRIADLAIKNRLPSMCERSEYVEAGCLVSYSANDADQYRRAAYYVDRILKGAKPAELPVEQPTKFELVINLKTAKQIGLTIPQSMLYRADKVIK
jgi:putative tryptophan/tyrosine transport system substrate-binding protein